MEYDLPRPTLAKGSIYVIINYSDERRHSYSYRYSYFSFHRHRNMNAAGYPHGRQLTDDIADNLVEIITQGKMKDDLAEFPYLGTPYEA